MKLYENQVAYSTVNRYYYVMASEAGIKELPENITCKGVTYNLVDISHKIYKNGWNTGLLNFVDYETSSGFHGNVILRLFR